MLRIGVSEEASRRKQVSFGVSSMVFRILFWAGIVIVEVSQIIKSFLPPIEARWALAMNSSVSLVKIFGLP